MTNDNTSIAKMVKLLLNIRYYKRRRKIKDLIHDSALGNIAPEKNMVYEGLTKPYKSL